jgi:hypothetical protein
MRGERLRVVAVHAANHGANVNPAHFSAHRVSLLPAIELASLTLPDSELELAAGAVPNRVSPARPPMDPSPTPVGSGERTLAQSSDHSSAAHESADRNLSRELLPCH